jgi:hypothetical protein
MLHLPQIIQAIQDDHQLLQIITEVLQATHLANNSNNEDDPNKSKNDDNIEEKIEQIIQKLPGLLCVEETPLAVLRSIFGSLPCCSLPSTPKVHEVDDFHSTSDVSEEDEDKCEEEEQDTDPSVYSSARPTPDLSLYSHDSYSTEDSDSDSDNEDSGSDDSSSDSGSDGDSSEDDSCSDDSEDNSKQETQDDDDVWDSKSIQPHTSCWSGSQGYYHGYGGASLMFFDANEFTLTIDAIQTNKPLKKVKFPQVLVTATLLQDKFDHKKEELFLTPDEEILALKSHYKETDLAEEKGLSWWDFISQCSEEDLIAIEEKVKEEIANSPIPQRRPARISS